MQDSERELLGMVREAIFANPFGSTRLAIDLAATGLNAGSPTEQVLARLVDRVGRTIATIETRSNTGGRRLRHEDRQLLNFGALFHVFHLFCPAYDEHIRRQAEMREESCRVEFAGEALGLLMHHGFSEADAVRYFSLFFQMRRAYFFISAIAGKSRCVADLRRALWNNIFTSDIGLYDDYLWNRMEDFSTMILGETGTGKGLAAAAIGRSGFIPFDTRSSRFRESFARAFVAINLSQFPEQLIESELFGHRKGAFTGAIETHQGVFSRCSPYGAIFLDEIGDVATPVQIKLLQVLQDRTFTPVGSHKTEKFQGRVIAATNRAIETARQEGHFRDDFYYRLCSDVIEVPPLRQRLREHPDELEEILAITVQRTLGRPSAELVARIGAYIRNNGPRGYPWPGNIRELEQCVRRFLLTGSYRWQTPPSVPAADRLSKDIEEGALSGPQLLARYCAVLYRKKGTYEAVAQQTKLDRRTVKKYIELDRDLCRAEDGTGGDLDPTRNRRDRAI